MDLAHLYLPINEALSLWNC